MEAWSPPGIRMAAFPARGFALAKPRPHATFSKSSRPIGPRSLANVRTPLPVTCEIPVIRCSPVRNLPYGGRYFAAESRLATVSQSSRWKAGTVFPMATQAIILCVAGADSAAAEPSSSGAVKQLRFRTELEQIRTNWLSRPTPMRVWQGCAPPCWKGIERQQDRLKRRSLACN